MAELRTEWQFLTVRQPSVTKIGTKNCDLCHTNNNGIIVYFSRREHTSGGHSVSCQANLTFGKAGS
jgi:hypothetical protein